MRMVFGLVLVLGIALAGFAVYMAQGFIAQTQAERDALLQAQAQAVPLGDVLIVTKAIDYGQPLTPADVKVIKWQKDSVPAGAFADVKALFPEGGPQTRMVLRQVNAFEPVLADKVTAPGEDAGLTSRLAKGMRAFTINVDVSSGVSGFLRPGDRVDVYWTGKIGDMDTSKLIDRSVKLIAIDQSANSDVADLARIARTVTVEVDPEQVAALTLAQSTGRLTLALVGNGDAVSTGSIEVSRNDLLGIRPEAAPEVAPAAEAPKVCTIRTNRGGTVVETPIPCTN